ncbi:MAG: ABC-type transport auxiliary lipoprotein family protein [Caulobacteraceae bacterium]
MIAPPPLARFLVVAVAAMALGGCITLLPKQKPAQLYRFGLEATAPTTATPAQTRFAVRAAEVSFDHAASGDSILTVTGDKTAYIAGARWITPASTLYRAALARAFDYYGGPARLLARGETARADYTLKLDMRNFEARYDRGAGAGPTVVVVVYAALDGAGPPAVERQRLFEARVPTGENSVGAITGAFDRAVNTVNRDIVAWVGAKGSG